MGVKLLQLVDEDQLPSLFGGTCICDGKDPNSCMIQCKGPWSRPDIVKLLDTHPLDYLMTSPNSGGGSSDEELDDDALPADLPGMPPSLQLELEEAGRIVQERAAEHQKLEEEHMARLDLWLEERNALTYEIGRGAIERAQGYYDSMTIWNQQVQEFARQQAR